MASPLPWIRPRFLDANGDPLAGGKLWTYLAGTTTPLATYTDESEESANTNPIVLDANGECDVWLGNASYKLVLMNSADVIQWTRDNIAPFGENSVDVEEPSPWASHAITDGQLATDLEGETVDLSEYRSAEYEAVIKRGTTVLASGFVSVQDLNGTGRVVAGGFRAEEAHGITFSVSQVGTVVQLRAAASSGPGDGTISLSRKLVPA